MNPSIHQERDRLLALHRYSILDTPPEPRFDELTQIACSACDAPFALISFVDENRQWFKSKVGFQLTETELLYSLCNFAIRQDETFVIPDLQNDPRFVNHPLLSLPRPIRFYAGALITTQEGLHLGTLCIMDYRPRQLLDFQKRILEHLAHTVQLELDVDFERKQIKNIEATLHTSSRPTSIREFTAGIAHEINNPLAIIQTRVSLLKRLAINQKITNEAVTQNVNKVEKVIERIQSILRELGGRANQNDEVNLTSIIQDSLFLFEERIQNENFDFKVENTAACEGIRVKGKSVQICQAILNLLINAYDAVKESETDKWVRLALNVGRDRVQIRIADGAPKITPQIERRLFQPFFTTKDNGRGTGLGLSVSRSLIESFGGKLYLEQTDSEKSFVIELLRA